MELSCGQKFTACLPLLCKVFEHSQEPYCLGLHPTSAPCDLSVPQFPHLEGEAGSSTSSQGWMSECTEGVDSIQL